MKLLVAGGVLAKQDKDIKNKQKEIVELRSLVAQQGEEIGKLQKENIELRKKK